VNVAEGANSSFTIDAGAGWQIADVMVDGVSAGAVAAYQFTGVAANHNIAASFIESGPVGVEGEVPAVLELAHPTPNPSQGVAWLRFSLPHEGRAQLEIIDLAGRRVWHAD